MSYRHGIYVSEKATDLIALSRQAAGVTLAIGTAPVHLASDPAAANEPVMCRTYNEAVSKLGYSSETGKWTLCEAMEVLYGQYQIAPVVFVNVFDPTSAAHTLEGEKSFKVGADHTYELKDDDLIPNTIVVEGATPTVTATDGGALLTFASTVSTATTLTATYNTVNMTSETMIEAVLGGIDATTGQAKGLELVKEIYPRFEMTVGQIIAPGFSQNATVGLKMAAKAADINGHFSALALVDLDTASVRTYSQAASAKTSNGWTNAHMAVCYPMVSYGGRRQWLSTHVAGLMSKVAQGDNDIPYRSPSNHELYIDGMIRSDGTNCYFGRDEANDLNGAGIVTVLRQDGWRLWGNRTAIYPSSSDPKDCWLNVRRMFDYVKAALVLNFQSRIDEPITRRNIESVVNSVNTYLNGLVSAGAILGGQVAFLEEDNSETDLMDGKLNFRCYFTPPSPAREINFNLEYDRSYLSTVF